MRLLKKNYRILVVFGIPIILIIIILIFYKYKPLKRESIPVTKSISNIQKKELLKLSRKLII